MNDNPSLFNLLLHLADNVLILGQRNAEWCGHGPVLEQDIAITNISLDLIGQARNFYQYAAALYNGFNKEEKESVNHLIPPVWKNYDRDLEEDDLAFLREEHQYLNLLLTELSNGDWAQTVLRQFFFSAFQRHQYHQLQKSSDESIAAIAEKSLKEITYHLRWSSEWVVRLGDGTEESKRRMDAALEQLWMFTGELFQPTLFELQTNCDPAFFKDEWLRKVSEIFSEATIKLPQQSWAQQGGKEGRHTEQMGYLLSEMQYMQRTYPNSTW